LLSRYVRKGPSSRVRHYNYLPWLERAGFHVTSAPLLDEEYLERLFRGQRRSARILVKAYWRRLHQVARARRYDLIWIEKEALPWIPASWELAILGKRPVVTDFDDPWHLRYATHHNPVVRLVMERRLETLVTKAKAVTVGNSMLADWAKTSGASSVIELPV